MHEARVPKNTIEFKLWGRYALFTDPLTKLGGEKYSYQVPTYEALKGVAKSIYWKPTLIWVIDQVRVMRRFRTQTKGTKPLDIGGGNTLSIYTFLTGTKGEPLEYQVRAHFEWNVHRPELEHDRVDGKHFAMARRALERGGRQDIFLGTRDCQGYVKPCEFGEGRGDYDDLPELELGVMFHGFDYPDETGRSELVSRFWRPVMRNGIIDFARPEDCTARKVVREMKAKRFDIGKNVRSIHDDAAEGGIA